MTLTPTYKYLLLYLKKKKIFFQGPLGSAPALKGLTFNIRYQGHKVEEVRRGRLGKEGLNDREGQADV